MAGCRVQGRFRLSSASIISVRSRAASAISRWPMTRYKDLSRTTRRVRGGGAGPEAAVCAARPPEPVTPLLAQDIGALRIAIAGGYFQKNVFPEATEAVARVARALGTTRTIEIPE